MLLRPPGTSFYTDPSRSCVSFSSTLQTKESETLVAWEQSKCSSIRRFHSDGSSRILRLPMADYELAVG